MSNCNDPFAAEETGQQPNKVLLPPVKSIQKHALGATQAGFPPACQQTISSSHVHRFVIPRCLLRRLPYVQALDLVR